jgi:hypothetical protein
MEIVRSKDVIFKFQQFQALADRVNNGAFIQSNEALLAFSGAQ